MFTMRLDSTYTIRKSRNILLAEDKVWLSSSPEADRPHLEVVPDLAQSQEMSG